MEQSESSHMKVKSVLLSLLDSCQSDEKEVRQAAGVSLAEVGKHHPVLLLQEWHMNYVKLKGMPNTQSPLKKKGQPPNKHDYKARMLMQALKPVISVMVKHKILDSGDITNRAIMGQVLTVVVEEMLTNGPEDDSEEDVCNAILTELCGNYMDKVMDVLLMHFQPTSNVPVNWITLKGLASLCYHNPHHSVPYVKAILSSSVHLMKFTKPTEVELRYQYCILVQRCSEAVLDYLANIEAMPDQNVHIESFNNEGNSLYEILYSYWLPPAKDLKLRLTILEAMASMTPFLSREIVLEKGVVYLSTLVSFYRKLGSQSSAVFGVTSCISQLLDKITQTNPSCLDTVLDQAFNALFSQVCAVLDYSKPSSVKNHHEAVRSFDTLMKYYPERVVSGLLQRFTSHDEKLQVGALTIIRHILNLPTKTLSYRLEEIFKSLHANLGETNPNVRKTMGQIVIMLGDHGCISGEQGKDFVEFIVKMAAEKDKGGGDRKSVSEGKPNGSKPGEGIDLDSTSLNQMGANVLQLLTDTVGGVESVLWPLLLDYLLQLDYTPAVSALCRSLASLAQRKKEAMLSAAMAVATVSSQAGSRASSGSPIPSSDVVAGYLVQYGSLQYCTSPNALLARLLVLASVPQVNSRGIHILKFLQRFSVNIHSKIEELWNFRFPLLLHYLQTHENSVEMTQWHKWLIDLLSDTLSCISDEDWNVKLVTSFVGQFSMYETGSEEKSFAILCIGHILKLVSNQQVVMDNLSSVFLAALETASGSAANGAVSCAAATFGAAASRHLELVMQKLDSIYRAQLTKKKSPLSMMSSATSAILSFSFMGRGGSSSLSPEEAQFLSLALVIQCIGQAAKNAPPTDLEAAAEQMTKNFLSPCLFSCRESERVRESVLLAVSDLAVALRSILETNPGFVMSQHEELLHSSIAVLQDNLISLKSKQMALTAITNLIQLPPNISQLTRCSLLKASFNTIFNSFLEADGEKSESYAVAREVATITTELESKLTSMVESLHILIRELLKQDMEQSTVDEIFTMLETWLRLELPLARELAVNILQGALKVYVDNVRLGVGSPTNFTPGPYMIGAMVPRCHDPSLTVRKTALSCLQTMLRILGIYEGLAPETVEVSVEQLNSMSARCNNPEMSSSFTTDQRSSYMEQMSSSSYHDGDELEEQEEPRQPMSHVANSSNVQTSSSRKQKGSSSNSASKGYPISLSPSHQRWLIVSESLTGVLCERIQHHHMLTLLDSLADGLIDSQLTGVSGCIAVLKGLVVARGSEVFQNIPGLATKIHFKLTMMSIDETSDLMADAAEIVHQLAVHNCRGTVHSLLQLELPFDQSACLIWTAIAGDANLSPDVLDILLDCMGTGEHSNSPHSPSGVSSIGGSVHSVPAGLHPNLPIKQNVNGSFSALRNPVAAASALTFMLDSRKMEALARREFGRIFSSLVVLAAHFMNARYERKKSLTTGNVETLVPFSLAMDAVRSLFAAVNCVAVANVVNGNSSSSPAVVDGPSFRKLIQKIIQATSFHAPHLVQLMVNSVIPHGMTGNPDAARLASLIVLAGVVQITPNPSASNESKGGPSSDPVMMASIIGAILKSVNDPVALHRLLVMEGLSGLESCSQTDVESLSESVISALIAGIEDEKCSSVSLAGLKGLAKLLPSLPTKNVHNAMDLISLKVRPYFEMSDADHRAAAISLYGALAKFCDGEQKSVYLDHCQSVLVSILLHSCSPHKETSNACVATMAAICGVAGNTELKEEIVKYNMSKGLEGYLDKLFEGSGAELKEMFLSILANCIGYFRSQNPVLRRNAVVLSSKLLTPPMRPAKQPQDEASTTKQPDGGSDGGNLDADLVNGVVGGVLDLLKDPDVSVRKTAALYIGELAVLQT